MSNTPALEITNLMKYFEQGEVHALDGVSVKVEKGEAVAIVGPSGSGKTTLLNLIGALDVPTSGSIRINGRDVSPAADLDRLRAEEIGFVFQLHNLITLLTATENVEIPMMSLKRTRQERRERARELLERVGLGHRLDFSSVKLSGGERQRVAIARALANGPSLLLGDEPTGNLDSQTGQDIMDLLLDFREHDGLTILIVTHDPAIANRLDRVVSLRDGKIESDLTS